MSRGIPITVEINPDQYHSLALLAERDGHETIREFLEATAHRLGSMQDERDMVELMNLEGYANWEIAERTGLLLHTIQKKLADLGLKSNRKARS